MQQRSLCRFVRYFARLMIARDCAIRQSSLLSCFITIMSAFYGCVLICLVDKLKLSLDVIFSILIPTVGFNNAQYLLQSLTLKV